MFFPINFNVFNLIFQILCSDIKCFFFFIFIRQRYSNNSAPSRFPCLSPSYCRLIGKSAGKKMFSSCTSSRNIWFKKGDFSRKLVWNRETHDRKFNTSIYAFVISKFEANLLQFQEIRVDVNGYLQVPRETKLEDVTVSRINTQIWAAGRVSLVFIIFLLMNYKSINSLTSP